MDPISRQTRASAGVLIVLLCLLASQVSGPWAEVLVGMALVSAGVALGWPYWRQRKYALVSAAACLLVIGITVAAAMH